MALDADGARVVVDDQTLLDTWSASSYPEIIKTDAPSGYWKLDETSGPTAANAMGGTGATINGAVTLGQAGGTGDGRTADNFSGGYVTLPGGFSDDAAVIGFIVRKLRSEVVAFEAWEREQRSGEVIDLV